MALKKTNNMDIIYWILMLMLIVITCVLSVALLQGIIELI